MPGRAGAGDITMSHSILSGVNWSIESDMFLGDFAERISLPHLALVTKGQYMNIGAPNIANPSLKPYVLVHSRQKVRKVLAHLVKPKDGKRSVITDSRVAIPEGYEGYFEILSEDGKPVKCIETVRELAKLFPELCLARGPVKAYLPDSDGELRNLYRSRQIDEGELLTLVGQFNFKRVTFLRCFDEAGGSVYFKMSQKAKFSPLARKDAITGVHLIRNLLDAKRFPLTVRLIQGMFPSDLRLNSHSPVVLRLQSVFTEDVIMVYVLQKDSPEFLAVPLNAHLKLAVSLNHPQIVCRTEFRQLCELCDELLPGHLSRVSGVVYDDQKCSRNGTPNGMVMLNSSNGSRPDLCVLSPEDTLGTTLSGESDQSNERCSGKISSPELVVSDEEIDQLYDYIRGLAPLPESCQAGYKVPPPPPLETLPSRKSEDSKCTSKSATTSEEDRQRQTAGGSGGGGKVETTTKPSTTKSALKQQSSTDKQQQQHDREARRDARHRSSARRKDAKSAEKPSNLRRDKSTGALGRDDPSAKQSTSHAKQHHDVVSGEERKVRQKQPAGNNNHVRSKHLSRSTEKLLQVGGAESIYRENRIILGEDGGTAAGNGDNGGHAKADGGGSGGYRSHRFQSKGQRHHGDPASSGNASKPRPLSMVLPENMAALYPAGSSPSDYYHHPFAAAGHHPQFPPPGSHKYSPPYHSQQQQQAMMVGGSPPYTPSGPPPARRSHPQGFPSLSNLHINDEQSPPASAGVVPNMVSPPPQSIGEYVMNAGVFVGAPHMGASMHGGPFGAPVGPPGGPIAVAGPGNPYAPFSASPHPVSPHQHPIYNSRYSVQQQTQQ